MKTNLDFCSTVGLFFSIIILSISLVSCSSKQVNEPTRLTENQVSKLINSYIKEHQISPTYTQFSVGKFRCDDKNSRELYRKLDIAGVISLNIDTTVVTRSVRTGTDYWTGKPLYSKKNQTVYTLTTSLTEDTQKYLVESSPFKEISDPDMAQPAIGDYPEFHLDEVVLNAPEVEEGEEAYKTVYAKGTSISLVKVRNIRVNQTNKDCAWFECILQNGRVTPAYRVIKKRYDNEKMLFYGKLQYYVDKGWSIVGFSQKESDQNMASSLTDLLSLFT